MKTKTTTDIYLAAAFLSLGAILEGIDRTDPRHMVFSFSDGSNSTMINGQSVTTIVSGVTTDFSVYNLDVWERSWANRTLNVNASSYAEAIRRMKSLVHSG